MILILVSILSVLCFLHYFFKHIALVKDVEDIPGPAGFPLIGNIADVLLPAETAMGVSLDPSKSSTQSYKKSIYRMGELILHRLVRPWIHTDFMFNLSPSGKEQKSTLNTLHSFTQNVINERKENYVKVVPVSNDEVEVIGKSKQRLAMLDLLLSAHDNNDIESSGISEEVDTFMFEGHDTTSMAIMFSLMCLANNPDIQERVFDEIFGIFGTSTRAATIQDLQQMRYLEQCLKETLRLYPSVPFISRTVSEPLKLPKHTIPAGLMVHVHIFDLHRDPTLYPNPEKFDPERFTAENCVKRHPFAYIPFSAGQRNCIGQKFALLEEKSVVSTILRNYRLEAITRPEDLKFFSDLVLRTTTPIKMKIRPRVIN